MNAAGRLLASLTLAGALTCAPIVRWPAAAGPPGSGAKDFNLRWDALDANGAPLNPYWAVQSADGRRLPPVDAACAGAPPDSAACTDQRPSRDLAAGIHRDVCAMERGVLPGHVNWMPVSYAGRVSWSHLADDGDVTLFFEPDDARRGVTRGNDLIHRDPARPAIVLEFAASETLSRFRTDWWRQLRARVEEWSSTSIDANRIEALLSPRDPARAPRAVVFGLLGLDCEHECKTELHPVYSLAIEVDDSPAANTWAIFARNWGTEGYCSRINHLLDLPENVIRLVLPSRGVRPPRVRQAESQYASTFATAPPPGVAYAEGSGVVVTFALPDPRWSVVSELVLRLDWESGAPAPTTTSVPRAAAHSIATAPGVGLMVTRAGSLGPANVLVPLPAGGPIGGLAERDVLPYAVPSDARRDGRDVLIAKRRGDEERLRLLCAEFRPVADELPAGWRRACAGR